MKPIYVLFVTFFCIVGSQEVDLVKLKCKINSGEKKVLSDMKSECAISLHDQVKTEIKAALTYLLMGSHFAKDTNYRPGFSKFFFEAANEEREHAIKIIEYLLMRGDFTSDKIDILNIQKNITNTWRSGIQALQRALKLEKEVTINIRNIADICEKDESFNDYHLVDYLTTDFLDEQYKGQRDLAGKISTLQQMSASPLGEFLFDKKLLNGEV